MFPRLVQAAKLRSSVLPLSRSVAEPLVWQSARAFASADVSGVAKTPLYDLHVEYEATLEPYCGYSMPMIYKGQSHIDSHNWVRKHAGLFDVSHMVQHKISGPKAAGFLQWITPSDVTALPEFGSTLSVLLNEEGGIVDDLIIVKHSPTDFYIVTNAGCREGDLKYLADKLSKFEGKDGVKHDVLDGRALIALQGPDAAKVLQKYTKFDLKDLKFGQASFVDLMGNGPEYHLFRGGYTGEDGFEIAIPGSEAIDIARTLLKDPLDAVRPIGLAARDSLRLEAGMCLYGHELTQEITPVEAGLTWVIARSRRSPETATFLGAEKILYQLKNKSKSDKIRVGIESKGPAARHGMPVYTADGKEAIGEVTSGSHSPVLGTNIGMAYVTREFSKAGTPIMVEIRRKKRPAVVSKLPFVAPKYYK